MLRTYKVRLYPTKAQAVEIEKHFGCVRWVWNWGLAKRIESYERHKKSISRFDLDSELPKLKSREETVWLKEVNAQSLQSALRNLDAAYTGFFREKKGFPKFKHKRGRQSYQCPQKAKISFAPRLLSVPKIQNIRFRDTRIFTGDIKTVTICRTPTRKYYASVLVENGKPQPEPEKRIVERKVIGVDLGIKNFATLSTGEKIKNPRQLKWALRKLKRLQRSLSRKQKSSRNRDKCRHRLATVHEHVVNQRKDFQHKLSTRLIRENQAVAIETLGVSEMGQSRRLSQAISDAAWAQFASMLEYKARWNGKTVLRIGRFEPSSRLCSCGQLNHELKLRQRTWKCTGCGSRHDRDILAANNIKRMALHPKNFLAAGSREFTPVEIGKS